MGTPDSTLAFRAMKDLDECTVSASDGRTFTKASPRLYPHQWSWDSAFIAMGLAHRDLGRAVGELRSLFAAQWANGKVPHIVFNPDVAQGAYFPDAERWDCAARAPTLAPATPRTSGICQPPVHAIALWEIWRAARGTAHEAEAKSALEALYSPMRAWHRYLLHDRDPEGSGLVTIVHPWESGCDNAPRWDEALAAVTVDKALLPPYERADLKHAPASERPTHADYDRFLWLVELYKRAGYDDRVLLGSDYPFQLKDVLLSALLVRANEALLAIAHELSRPDPELRSLEASLARGRRGLEARWDEALGGATDVDVRTAKPVRRRTIALFSPLVAGGLGEERLSAQLRLLDGEAFCGHPSLARKLPPSTSPLEPVFDPRRYWRGPWWPIVNWILIRALDDAGQTARANELCHQTLSWLELHGNAEYADPVSDQPLGSRTQAWTAAFVLWALDRRA